MKTICGWCRRDMGGESACGEPADEVSHGICPDCSVFFQNNHGVGLREFIERIGAPVLLVDRHIRVEALNAGAAAAVCQTAIPEIEKMLVGEILECAQARLPGGCGQAHACVMGCALRRCILDTLATGQPMHNVEARQEILTNLGLEVICFRISTAAVDGKVLLRIDRADGETPRAEPVSAELPGEV